jgi:hypothetical protein
MTSRTSLIYLLTATTGAGTTRRSVHLSPEKAKNKQASWTARGWTVALHRIRAECLDCGQTQPEAGTHG